MRPDRERGARPSPRGEPDDHRQVGPDPARRGPAPVAELLAEAADRPVGRDGVGDVQDGATGLAHVEREEMVHRRGRRDRAEARPPDGEQRPGHRGQAVGPALELADAPLVAPVQALVRRGGGRALVAPLEAPGRAARPADRGGPRRGRPGSPAGSGSRRRSGRRRRRRRPRTGRPGSSSARRAGAPGAGVCGSRAASSATIRSVASVEPSEPIRTSTSRTPPTRPGRTRRRSARRSRPPRRGRRSRPTASAAGSVGPRPPRREPGEDRDQDRVADVDPGQEPDGGPQDDRAEHVA